MTKTYSSRSNVKRAAIAELGSDAVEGVDYRLVETDGRWGWTNDMSREEPPTDAAGLEQDVKAAEAGFATTKHPRREGTKQARLIAMLKTPEGATIPDIVAEFGWLPHTARGAIAGTLKKKLGLTVVSEKVDGRGRVYRIPKGKVD
jgi:hypothetical protein